MFSRLVGMAARAGGVIGFADPVKPGLLRPFLRPEPGVGGEGVAMPVRSSYSEAWLGA